MAWSAYLVKTVTGQIGQRVEITNATWSISLNDIEQLSITLKKSSLPLNPKSVLTPWRGSVLLMWNNFPLFAGPIVSWPTETEDELSLSCAGIRSIFARRTVFGDITDWSKLAKDVAWLITQRSLGTIAKEIVKSAQLKAGGALPVSYQIPDEFAATNDADHQRLYQGFDIKNVFVDDVLTKLSNVAGGPDIMFRPRIIDQTALTWDLYTGTEKQPRIAQDHVTVWDTTSQTSPVSGLSIVSTGTYLTHRVYSIGAGQDQGTLITVSENLKPTSQEIPLLETAIAISQSEEKKVVKAHGDGYLAANSDLLRELTLTVIADELYSFGSYLTGDSVDLVIKGWFTLPDGRYRCRLLNMSGTLSSEIRLSLQTEEYYGKS